MLYFSSVWFGRPGHHGHCWIVQSVTPSMPGMLNSTCVLVLLFSFKLHFLNTTVIVSLMDSVEYTIVKKIIVIIIKTSKNMTPLKIVCALIIIYYPYITTVDISATHSIL